MGQVADTILASARLVRNYSDMLLKDVRPDQFARFAASNGKPVQSNHPAFVFGHLSLYNGRVAAMLGKASEVPPNPPKFEELFKAGVQCLDDPQGTTYPSMDAIRSHFFAGFDAAMSLIQAASDTDLARPNPAEGRMKELFPTVGQVTNFVMGPHPMSHLGQVSAWRRFMGLPSAM